MGTVNFQVLAMNMSEASNVRRTSSRLAAGQNMSTATTKMLLTALLHTDGPCLRGWCTVHHLRRITARRVTAQNLIELRRLGLLVMA